MQEPKYKRILLKISGEALAGDAHRGLNFDVIGSVCDVVKKRHNRRYRHLLRTESDLQRKSLRMCRSEQPREDADSNGSESTVILFCYRTGFLF